MKVRAWTLISAGTLVIAGDAVAQTTRMALESDRAANHAPLLERPAQLVLQDATLMDALHRLSEASGVPLAFSPTLVAAERRRIECDCRELSVRQALERLLSRTSFGYRELRGEVLVFRDAPSPAAQSTRYALVAARVEPVLARSVRPTPPARQAGTIAGRVMDAATDQPIRGASVRIDGTRRGTLTDNEGRYRLENIPAGTHTLAASMIGYSSQTQGVTVEAAEVASADFALELSAVRLDEVVVTATGAQRRVEVGHVLGNVRADSVVREAPVTRLSDLVGARVAGVQVIANTGFTGESPRIRIRGLGSFSRSRDPLVYVDGVRVESSTGSETTPWGIQAGRLNDMNPNEIESIEVVKGPSAATLYGTDAANGVIFIRTKRGQPGTPRWDVYFEGGRLGPGTSFENVDSYYSWGTNSAGQSQRCLLTQMAAGACAQDSLTVFNPLRHPETTPIGTGTRSQLGAQVSGGAAQLTYFLSGDYEQETGYLQMPALEIERIRDERGGAELPDWQTRPNALRRLSLRGSLDASIGENAHVRISSGLVSSNSRIPSNAVLQSAHFSPGFRDANDGWGAFGGRPGEALAIKLAEEVTRYTASLTGNWRPLAWLSARAIVGTDLSSTDFDGLQRRDEGGAAGRLGRRDSRRTSVAQHTVVLGTSASTNLSARLSSRTSVGVQYNRRSQLVTIASATDLPPGSKTVTGAANPIGQEGRVESVVAGAYLEQMLGLNDRMFLTGAVRVDGGSSFGRNFRTAVYPKASASWLISDEPFFPSVPPVDNLRLRLAYGQSGVQPGTTDALDLVSRFTSVVREQPTTGAALSRLGNPALKPERQREIEGGLDVDLIGGRVTVEGTYYDKLSTDALVLEPLAASVGLLDRWVNVGAVRNWGYEALIGLQVLEGPPLAWEVALNGSVNRNRLEELGVPGITSLGTTTSRHVEGFPLFGRWGRPILGYSDANGDGIIEPSEVQVGDTLEYLGPSHPPRQVTASTALSLLDGRLRLSSQFDYRGGHLGMKFSELNRCGFFSNCRAINDPSTPLLEQARAIAPGTSAGYAEDASFVRWRELAATYELPAALAGRLGASNLTLTFSGRNLRQWTSYSGVDPEVNAAPGAAGVEGNADLPTAPQTRYWLLRLDARF